MTTSNTPNLIRNKKSAAEIWNARYSGEGFLFGKEPCLALKSHLDILKKGRAIDIAMGEGRNSVFLAGQGFQAEGLDCSSKAIEKVARLAAEKKTTVEAKTQNLDFFLMPLMKYDSILMTYYKPLPRFFSEIRRGLVMGGTFLLEAYLVDHIKHQSAPNPNIDFEECYKANEVLGLLKEFQILLYREIPDGNTHTVQAIAKKVR